MAKLLKIVRKIVGGTLEWTLILVIAIAFAIRTSPVQTYLAQLATDFLSKELDTELRIDKVDIYFFDRVALDGVFVRDQHGDTLASLESIEVVLSSLDLSGNKVTLKSIGLLNGRVGISRDSLTSDYNYWFITDYFSGSKTKTKKEPIALTIKSLDIEKVDITYDDYRKSYNEYGMDYDHLGFKQVELHAKEFRSENNSFSFDLLKLSTTEKSGLVLRRLKSHCFIGEKGIFLSDLIINTQRSKVYASFFNMKMNGLNSIRSFVDSVTFDGIIDSSSVNLQDISYFAPALKGMYQNVHLNARLEQKVKNLKISDIDLRTGQRTILRGDILLPDFRSLDGSFLKENIDYAFIDLEDLKKLRLPDRAIDHFVQLDPMINRLGYFEVKKMNLIGYWSQFVLSSKQIHTQLGTVHLDNGLLFTELNEGGYSFERSTNSIYDVDIDSFNLGKFLDDPLYGKVDGSLFVGGVVGQKDIIRLNKLDGEIHSCGFNDYTYSNITVKNGSYINKIFTARIDVLDPHLALTYDGFINLNKGKEEYNFTVQIPSADLGKLHFVTEENAHLVAGFSMDMKGTNLSNYSGKVTLDNFSYTQDSSKITVPNMELVLTRGNFSDNVHIISEVANVEINGKVDPNLIVNSVNNMISGPLSTYFQFKPFPKKSVDNNFFDLTVDVKNASEVLAVFAPSLTISPGSHLAVHYDAAKREETIDFTAIEILYDSIITRNLVVNQSLLDGNFKTEIDASYFSLSDSLFVNAVDINIDGTENKFNTIANWNENSKNPAHFVWKTTLSEDSRVNVRLKPSFFSVKDQLWEIQNSSDLVYAENRMDIDHLVLERDEQFIAINGVLSDLQEDSVTINVRDLHLRDFSTFIKEDMDIEGNVKGDVSISTPFTSFRAKGEVKVRDLIINDEPIGDVEVEGKWDNVNSRMVMGGKLEYLKNETFDFTGSYYPTKTENSLDFNLDFKGMDLQFANAFIDPSVVREIRGNLKGAIKLTGSIQSPTIDGKLNLVGGNVKVDLLGVSYKLSGPIDFDGSSSAFYIDNMPMIDEEGNKAFVTAAINHTNFEDWNCDIGLNMEDDYSRHDFRGNPMPVERFLVLNTQYKEGDVYYGRAYATGTANIFITDGNTKINVDVATEKGTWIDLPMYGSSELEEGNYLKFKQKKGEEGYIAPKVDLSGLDLDLNFKITPDTKVKLIFNDKTGDEILAQGQGDLNIGLNYSNDLTMTGTYEVVGKESVYNFVLGPIKQKFAIEEEGSITWSGNPYDAQLNLRAYNPIKANIKELTQDIEGGSSSSQDVFCYMNITQTLVEPLITLDIQAPNASVSDKAILASAISDKTELQRQFFSLLLFKKFAPLSGQSTAGGGGLADVITNQLNAVLDGLSDDVKFKLKYEGDQVNGNKSYELGLTKSFGQNENIILTGSFGVANTTSGEAQTNLIGDMKLEYLINEDGSFRANIFNESNDNSVLQDKTQGAFTQGVGLHYQEEFNSVEDFKLIQIILDLFRDEKKVKIKKRRKEVPIDPPKEENKTEVIAPVTNVARSKSLEATTI